MNNNYYIVNKLFTRKKVSSQSQVMREKRTGSHQDYE